MRVARWFELALSQGIPRRSLTVMLVVGPILTLINQGDRLFAGQSLDWFKMTLTFAVPYVVATVGAVGASAQKSDAEQPAGAPASCQDQGASLGSRPLHNPDSGVATLQARVHVTLKQGVLDPQGKAIEAALGSLGFAGVEGVRQGKVIELTLAEGDRQKARAQVEAMCEKLLANTVIENYDIELDD